MPLMGQDIFSFKDIMSVNNRIIIIGSYKELVNLQGIPDDSITTSIGITDYVYHEDSDSVATKKLRKIIVTYLSYGDSLLYIRIGDSVQISYADFSASDIVLKYREMIFKKNYSFRNAIDAFALKKPKYNYLSIEKKGNKLIKTYTFGLHTKDKEPFDDNLWFVFFHKNNRLWYMDFPLKCDGSIVK